ncbi:MAG: nucleotide exchange factor GrpE [Candidatus Omnitrophica bacterium]|nr:nucleotide exchange factor GrpE [Candidatus Omnitrophota bacterium]
MHRKKETGETTVIRVQDLNKLKESSLKLKDIEKALEEKKAEILEIKERYLRTAAEFDNYKKRTEREKRDIFKFGTETLVLQLLPFDDIFEAVVKQMENNPSPESVHKGLEMLKKEFTKLLDGIGVKRIETEGKPFNHEFHEAAETVETEDYEEGAIIEEVRSGYSFHDKILRPALVKVAKKPAAEAADKNENPVPGKD